jgi:hypothetical protein
MVELFYLQDSRSYTGNCMMWWAVGGGYTSRLGDAAVYTLEAAQTLHNARETDIPWPKEYIEQRTALTVDHQYCKRDEALADSSLVLQKPKPHKKGMRQCGHCGVFINDIQQMVTGCPKCGKTYYE